MRFICILLLLASGNVYSQEFSTAQIASFEKQGHARLNGSANISQASTNIDVKKYRCEWTIDPAVRYISGSVVILFQALTNTDNIILDLKLVLSADSVKTGNSGLFFQQQNDALIIQLGRVVLAGTLDSVRIWYHGVPAQTGFGSFIQTSHLGVPVIWTLSEPYGASDWWPCKNDLTDKADTLEVILHVPEGNRGVSNGLLIDESTNGITRSMHWKSDYPIASYLVCLAVTNFYEFNREVPLGNVMMPMQTFCYPESATVFEANTQKTIDALQLFQRYFGPYPFLNEKYGHVQFSWGGGMEHQTNSFIVNVGETLTSHELAHQWFGDKITTAAWESVWLNEGFATFLARFYMEEKYPQNTLNARRVVVGNITSQPGGSVRVNDTANLSRIFDSRLSYDKGSYLLQMLRYMVGDSLFFKGMRQYVSDPALAYGFATTADFQRNMEAASGRDLTLFFNEWYYGEGYPMFNIKWNNLGSTGVKFQVNQQTSHPAVPYFHIPVPLTFQKGGLSKTILVDPQFSGEIFEREIGFSPDTVLVDEDLNIISANNTSERTVFPLTGNPDISIYPNPASGTSTLVSLSNFQNETVLLQLYNVAGQFLFERKVDLINGAERLSLPVTSLPRGVYVLKCTFGKNVITKKLLR